MGNGGSDSFGNRWWRALFVVSAVACTFFYFLIFAQFALLHRIEDIDTSNDWLRPIMLLMGLGGLVGSGLVWKLYSEAMLRTLLSAGFVGCALFAFLSVSFQGIAVFLLIGLAVGVSLGILTVSIVLLLERMFASGTVGMAAGLGTGVAYFGSNVPYLFQQDAITQCLAAGGVALLGFLVVLGIDFAKFPLFGESHSKSASSFTQRERGYPIVIALFFVLVWLDSAAFYVIQEVESLKSITWEGDGQLWANATLHFVAAIASGIALVRGWLLGVLGIAGALLVLGTMCLKVEYNFAFSLASGFYVVGVSLYSTALVGVAALFKPTKGWSTVKRGALLFGIAGWIGSGLGIGMARDLGKVPNSFLVIATVALGGLAYRAHQIQRKATA